MKTLKSVLLLSFLLATSVSAKTFPDYCFNNSTMINVLACKGAHPDYCKQSTSYADALACEGSFPDYCRTNSQFANSLACNDPIPTVMVIDKR